MCSKNLVDICISKRDDDNRLMDPPIIELEFEKRHPWPTYDNWRRKTLKKIGTKKNDWERNIKTKNTFSVLEKEDTEPLWEEEEPLQIVKIDKDEKKVCELKWRGRIRKAHSERKG